MEEAAKVTGFTSCYVISQFVVDIFHHGHIHNKSEVWIELLWLAAVVFASLSDSSVTGAAEHGPRSRTVSFTESVLRRGQDRMHTDCVRLVVMRGTPSLHDSGLDPNSHKNPWEAPADD